MLQGALLSTLVGVPFGIAASFAAWFIVFRGFVPKFIFSEQISEIPGVSPEETPQYRIKIKNIGRRNAIDVDVFSRLRVRNLLHRPEFSATWTIVTLTSDTTHEPRIPRGANRVVVLGLDNTPELSSTKFQAALNGRAPTLEVLLSLGEAAELVVWVLAFDEFSCARKAFISKHYQICDICKGKFGGKDGLEVVPLGSEKTGGSS
jgi:hypothetical protein